MVRPPKLNVVSVKLIVGLKPMGPQLIWQPGNYSRTPVLVKLNLFVKLLKRNGAAVLAETADLDGPAKANRIPRAGRGFFPAAE